MKWLIACCAATLVHVSFEPSARACQTATVCVTAPIITDDLEASDYPSYQEMDGTSVAILPVRGVRAMLVPPAPEPPRTVFADANGCITFESSYGDGLKLLVYPEALIGENRNIHVRAFPTHASYIGEIDSIADYDEGIPLDPWLCHINDLAQGDSVECELPESDLSRLLTLTLDVIERVDQMASPRLQEIFSYRAYTLAPDEDDPYIGLYPPNGLGAGGTSEMLFMGHEAIHKKFVFSHEIGHGFFFWWGGWLGPPDPDVVPYSYESGNPYCQFVAVSSNSVHGIRSAERGTDAYREGFAQFVSTIAFDDAAQPDAIFQYYKEIDLTAVPQYAQFVDDDYKVSMIGGEDNLTTLGGRSAWVENMCAGDWSHTEGAPPTLVEISSEMDWMRFLWQFWSLDLEINGVPSAKPTLREVVKINEYVRDAGLVPDWNGAYEVISNPANADIHQYLERFEALTAVNGVDNGA